MFFRRPPVTCDIPHSEMLAPMMVVLVGLLAIYAILLTIMLFLCRQNLLSLRSMHGRLDDAETRNAMAVRNMANERVSDHKRLVRVMGSIVDVLKH
jgi:hypothetical protein